MLRVIHLISSLENFRQFTINYSLTFFFIYSYSQTFVSDPFLVKKSLNSTEK